MSQKMKWSVTWSTDSVHVRILTSLSFNQSGPPWSVLGLYPGYVGQDVPVEENPAMAQTFINQFVKAHGNYLATDLEPRAGFTLLKSHGGGF